MQTQHHESTSVEIYSRRMDDLVAEAHSLRSQYVARWIAGLARRLRGRGDGTRPGADAPAGH